MVNRAYLKRHGIDLEAALGKTCKAMEEGCRCPLAGRELRRALESRRETREEIRTEAGEIFRVYHYPILDEAGEIWGVLRYAKDITLEKQVEQRIQQTEKLAALGQLGAGVAHEINNPMGIILCYTDLIRRQLAEADPIDNDLNVIEKQARNCQRIVTDLLNFARGGVAERRAENVNTAVAEVADMVRPQFRKRGTELTVALNETAPPVPMDIDRMKQVFLNLMMNAQQAIGDGGGTIRVETGWSCTDRRRADCAAGEEVVEITIADNGGGIPPEVVEKIFDPFFSTKKTGEGTGLGLSVSYGIVKDHGGGIGVESEPGKGTRFTVRLPVSPPEGGTP
jgi:signal transduction histidine kinase